MVEETRRLMELTATEGHEGARIMSVRKPPGEAAINETATNEARDSPPEGLPEHTQPTAR